MRAADASPPRRSRLHARGVGAGGGRYEGTSTHALATRATQRASPLPTLLRWLLVSALWAAGEKGGTRSSQPLPPPRSASPLGARGNELDDGAVLALRAARATMQTRGLYLELTVDGNPISSATYQLVALAHYSNLAQRRQRRPRRGWRRWAF